METSKNNERIFQLLDTMLHETPHELYLTLEGTTVDEAHKLLQGLEILQHQHRTMKRQILINILRCELANELYNTNINSEDINN